MKLENSSFCDFVVISRKAMSFVLFTVYGIFYVFVICENGTIYRASIRREGRSLEEGVRCWIVGGNERCWSIDSTRQILGGK
jgi:hypothetical protein